VYYSVSALGHCSNGLRQIMHSEGFFQKSKVSSEEAEGFFPRVLGSYTHRFQNGAQLCLRIFWAVFVSSGAAYVSSEVRL